MGLCCSPAGAGWGARLSQPHRPRLGWVAAPGPPWRPVAMSSVLQRRALGCLGVLGSIFNESPPFLFSDLRAKGDLGQSNQRMSISSDFHRCLLKVSHAAECRDVPSTSVAEGWGYEKSPRRVGGHGWDMAKPRADVAASPLAAAFLLSWAGLHHHLHPGSALPLVPRCR